MKLSKTILFVFFIFISVNAQETLSLESALEIALSENLNVKMIKNTNQLVVNNANIGNVNLLPKVDLTASTTYSDNENIVNGNGIYSANTTNIIGARATYTVFDGFANINRYLVLKSNKKISDYNTKSAIENIVQQTTSLYYDIANLSAQLNSLQQSLGISRERVQRIKDKSLYGQAKSIEYLSAVVDYNKDSLSFVSLRTQFNQAKNNFRNILNKESSFDFNVDNSVAFENIPEIETLTSNAFEFNSNFLAVKEETKIAQQDLEIAQSEYFPKLSLESSYGYNTNNNEFDVSMANPNRSFYTGINLSFNVFNGFQTKIKTQNSKILLKNSEINLENEKSSLKTTIENTYELYKDSRLALELEEVSLETAKLNFERTKEFYNLGKVTLTQFREAQLNLLRANNNISNLKYSIKKYEVELKRLTGSLI